ncbi:unnamed protein product [Dimorphilus gyrociliatus]|uniref:Uncharacterized protein n=1 Tax=Dimorphilus gyrociliatus TaxID=2664684 RepID=A0A7I8WEM6_9ANNE|nr:unnamed protein product [Dimorphilus gyrociliatus]
MIKEIPDILLLKCHPILEKIQFTQQNETVTIFANVDTRIWISLFSEDIASETIETIKENQKELIAYLKTTSSLYESQEGGNEKAPEAESYPLSSSQRRHQVIERHEILRTVFREDENGTPRQYILNMEDFNFS